MSLWWIEGARGYLSGYKHRLPRRGGIRVLCYHGVVERKRDPRLERNLHLLADFEAHLHFLRHCRTLTLSEWINELENPRPYQRPGVLLTFDDGYLNNLKIAELLDKLRIPWTLFVSTGALGRGKTIWTVELSLLLLHGQARFLEVFGKQWSLATRAQREEAFQRIRYPMKRLPAIQRRQVMEWIRQQFPEGETERLLERFPSLQMLTWEEVRQLADAGVEIGSHGVEHEIHHSEQPPSVRWDELVRSKEEIERRLERPCRYFAYPNGDFTEASPGEVREAGYRLAFTLEPRTTTPGDDLYLLPRLVAPGSVSTFVRAFFWESR